MAVLKQHIGAEETRFLYPCIIVKNEPVVTQLTHN